MTADLRIHVYAGPNLRKTLRWSDHAHVVDRSLNIGAPIFTYTILGVPYCKYSIIYPETLF